MQPNNPNGYPDYYPTNNPNGNQNASQNYAQNGQYQQNDYNYPPQNLRNNQPNNWQNNQPNNQSNNGFQKPNRAYSLPKMPTNPLALIKKLVISSILIFVVLFGLYFTYSRITGQPFSTCLDLGTSNNLCFSAVSKQQAQVLTQTASPSFGNLFKQQQTQKNELRDLWEQQAASNDDLVLAQLQLNNLVKENLEQADRNIRFVDGNAELLTEFKESDYQKQKAELENKIAELEKFIATNADRKAKASKRIAEIYVESGEIENDRFIPQ